MGTGVGKVHVVIKARARESGSNVLPIFSTVLSPGIASIMTKRGELLLLLVRSRPGSSSFTASALNKPSSSSSSSSSSPRAESSSITAFALQFFSYMPYVRKQFGKWVQERLVFIGTCSVTTALVSAFTKK